MCQDEQDHMVLVDRDGEDGYAMCVGYNRL